MREMDVVGVRVEMPANLPMVLLREVVGHRYLPIWIAATEASAIANAQEGVLPPRPLTHDLMAEVITTLGHRLSEVHITQLTDNVFHAALIIDGVEIDARASDAIALALRTGSDIYCADDVLDAAGIDVPSEADDQVEKFREFLDSVSADDFVAPEAEEGEPPSSPTSPSGPAGPTASDDSVDPDEDDPEPGSGPAPDGPQRN